MAVSPVSLKSFVLAVLFVSASGLPSFAQDGIGVTKPTPEYKSMDGNFTFKLRGRVYWDQSWGKDDNGTMDYGDTEFKAARLGFEGKINKKFSYVAEVNLSGSNLDFTVAYVTWKGPVVDIRVGYDKSHSSLEEDTSSRRITFMERASFTDAFGYTRGFGIGILKGGDDWTFSAVAQKGTINGAIGNGTTTFASRVTKSPKMDDLQWHFGASVRYRKIDDSQSDLGYSQRPHAHLADKFLNTGRIADKDLTMGLEAALLTGSFAIQSEVATLKANLTNPLSGQKNPTFKGGYIDFSWFATGENRPYDPKKGNFSGVKPKTPWGHGGYGALQFTARLDAIDLGDEGIEGGRQTSMIAGVNWYPNRWTRVMFNYSHSLIKDGFLVAANGPSGENKVDALGLRFQINW